jgi:prevent-host-death family protein
MGSWGWGLVYLLIGWTSVPFLVAFIEWIRYVLLTDEAFRIRADAIRPKLAATVRLPRFAALEQAVEHAVPGQRDARLHDGHRQQPIHRLVDRPGEHPGAWGTIAAEGPAPGMRCGALRTFKLHRILQPALQEPDMGFSASDVVPFTQARANLSELADQAKAGTEKIITKNGQSYVALIDADRLDYYHRLERERIHLLLIDDARRGLADIEAGRTQGADAAIAQLQQKRRTDAAPTPATTRQAAKKRD